MEFFGAGRATNGVLVRAEGGGDLWGDVFGDSGGDDSAEDGTTCDWANVAVGFEEWDDPRGGEGIQSVRVHLGSGEDGQDACQGLEGWGGSRQRHHSVRIFLRLGLRLGVWVCV